jgi:hypothetical protein
MAQPSVENSSGLEDQALLIAGEIFNLINQYTHDSTVSKFFLSDEVANACYGLAAGFASVIYTPELEPEETVDSALLSFLYALMTYGFNIYLKERSLRTNASPYRMPTDDKTIKKAQRTTLTRTSKGDLFSTPLSDKIIMIIIENIEQQMDMTEFTMRGHRLNKKKFWDYTKLSMYWGYNFAGILLEPEKNKTTTKVKTKE